MSGGCIFFAACILYQHVYGAAAIVHGAAAGGALGLMLLEGLVIAGALLYVFSKGAKFSLFKPAEEMVYITLDEEGRTRGKAAIDVVGAQTGKSGGSLLQQVLLLFSAGTMTGILPVMFLVFFFMLRGWLGSVKQLSAVRSYTPYSMEEEEGDEGDVPAWDQPGVAAAVGGGRGVGAVAGGGGESGGSSSSGEEVAGEQKQQQVLAQQWKQQQAALYGGQQQQQQAQQQQQWHTDVQQQPVQVQLQEEKHQQGDEEQQQQQEEQQQGQSGSLSQQQHMDQVIVKLPVAVFPAEVNGTSSTLESPHQQQQWDEEGQQQQEGQQHTAANSLTSLEANHVRENDNHESLSSAGLGGVSNGDGRGLGGVRAVIGGGGEGQAGRFRRRDGIVAQSLMGVRVRRVYGGGVWVRAAVACSGGRCLLRESTAQPSGPCRTQA